MAKMFPPVREILGDDVPLAERLVYESLEHLPNEYIVFHSVQWTKQHKNKNFTWKENDFVIVHPKRGIIVMEVKGGLIKCQNGVMYQQNQKTGEWNQIKEGSDPYTQAKKGMFYYREVFEPKIFNMVERLPFMTAVWFPGAKIGPETQLPSNYKEIEFAILDSEDLEAVSQVSIEKVLRRIYQHYGAANYIDLSNDEVKLIIDTIAPDFHLIPSPSIVKVDLDRQFLRLSNEQSGLLDYIEEQGFATIQGAAGTGKTVVALEAAKRFADQNRKVLFLCYNSFLYEHLRDDCAHENVDYRNIHALAARYTTEDVLVEKNRVAAIESIDPEQFEYDDIIIDEAQDLEDAEVMHLKMIAELREGHFFAFYDKNQIVLKRETPKWIDKSECKLVLTRNCRNTYEIACTAYNVIDAEVKQRLNAITGVKPSICFAGSDSEAMDRLEKLISFYMNDENGYKENEITILSLVSEKKSFLRERDKIGKYSFTRERDGEHIFVTTAKKFKGLEGKVIIIIDIDRNSFNDDQQKRNFYVACSRATHRLSLFINADAEQMKEIADVIPGKGFKDQAKIVMKTKTKKWEPI